MAVDLVRLAIQSAIEKTLSQSPRAMNMKRYGQDILISTEIGPGPQSRKRESFDKFCIQLLSYLQGQIRSVASKYKLNKSKREKLWSLFHNLRTKGVLPSLWKEMLNKLDMKIDDPLLEQTVNQEVFEVCLREYFAESCTSNTAEVTDVELTANEMNVIRYVGGYVARSLLKRYEKKKGQIQLHSQFIDCLGEMAVEGDGDDVLTYTRTWFDLVNRGGLYPLNDDAFTLFANIERCVRSLLAKHMLKSSSDKETFKKNVHDKVCHNEDVQFHWTLLSQDIYSLEDAEHLLGEIVDMWVTIRGFSMVASWMEVYKSSEKKNIQKSTGLRKSLSGTSTA